MLKYHYTKKVMTNIKCFASANKYYLSKEQIVAVAIIYPQGEKA